jgi:hypothetical protein
MPAINNAPVTPTGSINGSNTAFTVASSPALLVLNGVMQLLNTDYTYSAGTITYTVAPLTGDWHQAFLGIAIGILVGVGMTGGCNG